MTRLHPGTQLLTFVLVVTVLGGSAGAVLISREYQTAQRQARNELAGRATIAARSVERFLSDRIELLQAIAASPAVRSADPTGVASYFTNLAPLELDFRAGISWLDPAGVLRVSSAAVSPQPIDLSDRDYVRQVLATRRPYVGEAVIARQSDRPVLVIAVPAFGGDGGVTGLVTGAFWLDQPVPGLESLGLAEPSTVILDRSGRAIWDGGPVSSLENLAGSPVYEELRTQGAGIRSAGDDLRGRANRLIGFDNVPAGDWLVMTNRDAAALLDPARDVLRAQLWLLTVPALLAIAAAMWSGYRLNAGERERERLLEAVSNERRRLAGIISGSPGVVFEAEGPPERFDEHITFVSAGISALMETDRREWLAQARPWYHAIHPIDRDLTFAKIASELQSGHSIIEFRIVTALGNVRWVEAHTRTVTNRSGDVVSILGTVLDISARRQAEADVHRWEQVFAHSSWGVAVAQPKTGTLLAVNPALADMLGIPARSLVDAPVASLVTTEYREAFDAGFRRVGGGGRFALEAEQGRRDGSRFPALLDVVVEHGRDGPAFAAINVRDITEQKAAEAERERLLVAERVARADAEAANLAKDAFLNTAAHELKTPVAVIKGYTQMLTRRGPQPQEAAIFNAMDRATERLTRLIEDLLEVSRTALGRLEYHQADFNLVDLVKFECARAEKRAPSHPIHFHTNVGRAVIHADEGRIGQVLTNLLTNADKYSGPDTPITVSLAADTGDVTVSVRDEGVGIPEDRQRRVFELFFRAHTDQYQYVAGMGTGLHLSKAFIEQHGGRMWFDSIQGQGSAFYFCLPLVESDNVSSEERSIHSNR